METAQFRFYGSLNFFLPRSRKHKTITYPFNWRASIKDMIESLGVPHTEIELLVVNDASVSFDHLVQPGDDIHVYPCFDAVDGTDKIRLRPPISGRPRFVLDTHLGRLASYLRMMGFDTLYRIGDYPDEEIAQVAHDETRIVLTRDMGVLKRNLVIYGYYVRNTDPRQQITEVMRRFDLATSVEPFKHCLKCNGPLEIIAKEAILDKLPYRTKQCYDEFHCCQNCGKIFWKGSHYERMKKFIAQVVNTSSEPGTSNVLTDGLQ